MFVNKSYSLFCKNVNQQRQNVDSTSIWQMYAVKTSLNHRQINVVFDVKSMLGAHWDVKLFIFDTIYHPKFHKYENMLCFVDELQKKKINKLYTMLHVYCLNLKP